MPNRLRFRSGQVHLARLRVDGETVLSAGDLVWLDEDQVKPASAFPWNIDLSATQSDFAGVFLGVAHQPSAAGDAADISVDLSPHAVYEFDVAPAVYGLGDLLGPGEQSSALMDQQLEQVASAGFAMARAAEYRAVAASTLRVLFASAFHTGSANASAAVG